MAGKSFFGIASLVAIAAALPQAQVTDPADADDLACVTSWRSYDSNSVSYEGPDGPKETLSTVVNEEVVTDKSSVPQTTLCGKPYALAPFPTSIVLSTTTFDPPLTIGSSYPSPRPECTINPQVCESVVYPAYDAAYSSWQDGTGPSPTEFIHCTTTDGPEITAAPEPVPTDLTYVPDCGTAVSNCFIYGPGANKLYYWPVTTIDGDFCLQNGSTITPTPTDPAGAANTAVVDGFTFTSPTNYFSLDSAEAYLRGRRPRITQCGPTTALPSNTIIPLIQPFSSFRGINGISGTFTFNYHDFQTPIPAPIYEGQRKCRFEGNCDVIPFENDYVPMATLPADVIDLVPEWVQAGCQATGSGFQIATYVALGATPVSVNVVEETGAVERK